MLMMMLTLFYVHVCKYVCMRKFITRGSYSLSSHECAPVGNTKKIMVSKVTLLGDCSLVKLK